MAITLTVSSVTSHGGTVQVVTIRSDNGATELIIVDVSSAPSAVTAINLITATITAKAVAVNTTAANTATIMTLVGQVF